MRTWAGAALGAEWYADQTSLLPCTEASGAGSLTGQPPGATQVPAHKQSLLATSEGLSDRRPNLDQLFVILICCYGDNMGTTWGLLHSL